MLTTYPIHKELKWSEREADFSPRFILQIQKEQLFFALLVKLCFHVAMPRRVTTLHLCSSFIHICHSLNIASVFKFLRSLWTQVIAQTQFSAMATVSLLHDGEDDYSNRRFMTPCSVESGGQRLGGIYRLHLQSAFGCDTSLWNVDNDPHGITTRKTTLDSFVYIVSHFSFLLHFISLLFTILLLILLPLYILCSFLLTFLLLPS